MEDKLLTTQEVADYLRLSLQTIRTYVSKGRMPFIRIGRSVRFRRVDIEAWIMAGAGTEESGRSLARASERAKAGKEDWVEKALDMRERIRAQYGELKDVGEVIDESRMERAGHL